VNANFTHDSSSIALQLWLLTGQECATEDSRSHLPRPPPLPDPTTDKSECKCMLQREYVVSIWRRGFRRANLTGVDLQETPTLHYNKSLIEFEAERHCTPTGVCCSPSRSVVPSTICYWRCNASCEDMFSFSSTHVYKGY